jgi:hypothetical protein
MLRSLYALLDYNIAASDGVQGLVRDFLFDDESWIVHYLVAETATPIGARSVLIAPFMVGPCDWETKRLTVRLTSQQIQTSPPLEADMPIARQRETGIKRPGSHLRSVRELIGYMVHTRDGEAGRIEDLIIEDTLWGVHHIAVALKNFPRSVLLFPEPVRSISWSGKAVWVNLPLQELENAMVFNPGSPVNHDREDRHYDYYGRLVSPPLQHA